MAQKQKPRAENKFNTALILKIISEIRKIMGDREIEKELAVITPYRLQSDLIQSCLRRIKRPNSREDMKLLRELKKKDSRR